ncbi:MAG: right-handed parallel beta-helix repeat-containing protein [Candidatus Micrarchaeia archaeon]
MFRRISVFMVLLGLMGFGFSQFSDCTNISLPGSYSIDSSLTGNLSFGGVEACIYINASDVSIYCKDGVTITGDKVDVLTRGIYVVNANNVTVQNCPDIVSYGIGLHLSNVENSTIGNITVRRSYSDGVRLNTADYNNMTNLTSYNNSGEGFHLVQSTTNRMDYFVSYNNTLNGFYLEQASNSNNISFAVSYQNKQSGFREADIDSTVFLSNAAYNNTVHGYNLASSNLQLFNNNSAIQNLQRGFSLTASHFNLLGNNSAFLNGLANVYDGFYLFGSENNTLINNTAVNNTLNGFSLTTSSFQNNLTDNRAENNSRSGFNLQTASNGSNLSYNIANFNLKDGFTVSASTDNILDRNNATQNVLNGFNVTAASTGNNLTWNFAEKSGAVGFIIDSSNSTRLEWNMVQTSGSGSADCFNLIFSSYLVLVNNSATGGLTGFYANNSHYSNYTNNSAFSNGDDGFTLDNSSNNTLTRNFAFSNSGNGFYFTDALTSGNVMAGSTAYLNIQSGFRFSASSLLSYTSSNNVSHSVAYRNQVNGFRVGDYALYYTMDNNTAYNNTDVGILFSKAYFNNMSNTTMYGNSNYGLSVSDAGTYNLFWNTSIYNQSSYINAPANTNFTNITFGYNSTIGLINYRFINTSTTLQLTTTNLLLNPSWVSLDDASANAVDANQSANITISTDSCAFPIWRKLGFPITLADIIANGSVYTPIWTVCLSGAVKFGVTSFSGYTSYDSCVNLSDSATWSNRIVNDTATGILNVNENTTLCRGTYPVLNAVDGRAIEMNASNIFLDCNGSTIDGIDGSDAGIYTDSTENDTIKNCYIRNYQSGLFLASGSNKTTLINITSYNNSVRGIYLSSSHFNALTNITAYNNSNGFFLTGAQNNSVTNASAYNNTAYGFLIGANRNNFTNAAAYNNSIGGFSLLLYSSFNLFDGSSAYLNHQYGFELNPAENNTVRNSVAYNNTLYGFYINFSIANNFTNDTAYGHPQHGFFLVESNNSRLVNNTAYNNTYGFYVSGSNYSVFTNNTARNNSQTGFQLFEESTYSNITDSRAYGNVKYGFYLDASGNNLVEHSVAYDNDDDGFFSDASSNSLFNNLTAYRNKDGISLQNGDNLTLANSTAYSNLAVPGIGLFIYSANNATATNNTAYDNNYGFLLMHSNYSTLQRNVLYNNTDGVYINYVNGTLLSNTTAFSNANYGFDILSSSLNNFTDSLAHSNLLDGLYLNSSNNNSFLNTVSYGNGPIFAGDGFSTDTANNNSFRNTLLYGNGRHGFYVYASANNVFFNTTIHTNGIQGIQLWDNFPLFGANSSGNNFTDTLAYNNGAYGIYVLTNAWNHFTRTFIYNQTAYLSIGSTDQPQNFTNLTLGYSAISGLINYSPYTINITSVDLYTQEPLSASTIILRDYWVSLSEGAEQVNKTANITVYTPDCTYPVKRLAGFPTDLNDILTNGTIYPTNVDCTPGVDLATFNVTGFSGYALGIVPTFLTMNISPGTTFTYGTEINVTCSASNNEVNLTIYRNATLVQNGTGSIEYLANLSGGTYNFTCNTTGDENYTSANTSALVTVNMNTTVLTLTMPTGLVSPGAETNISCAASNPEVNLTLYRNGVEVANGTSPVEDIQNLSAGTYIYLCNTSGTENYTSAATSGILRFRSTSSGGGGGDGPECFLEVAVNETVPVGTDAALQVFRYTDEDATRVSLFGANVSIIYGSTVVSYLTDTQGYVHYTPASLGTYTYAAFFGDCSDTDGTFRAVAGGPITIGFEQGCTSTILLYREICEDMPTEDPTTGAIGCSQVPVAGETVHVYRCTASGETEMTINCTQLLGTFTTDSNGEVDIDYKDGNIRIVVPATATHGESVDYQQLLPASVCSQPPEITTIGFDPGCPSTITVMEAGCRELMQDLSGAEIIEMCSERPMEGARVQVYRCDEPYMAEAGIECGLIGTYTTNSEGQATTDEVDGYIRIVATGEDGVPYETSGTLPSSQECAECASDSDCGQDELCRGGQCVPRDEVPPEERPCSTASDCPTGYGCGNSGLCTQQPVLDCVRDDQCGAGYLCREDTCVDEQTVIGGGGVEGGGIAGLLGNIINAVQKSFVFLILLLALLLLLWFFFWRKKKKQRAKGPEELIAQEEERARPRRK